MVMSRGKMTVSKHFNLVMVIWFLLFLKENQHLISMGRQSAGRLGLDGGRLGAEGRRDGAGGLGAGSGAGCRVLGAGEAVRLVGPREQEPDDAHGLRRGRRIALGHHAHLLGLKEKEKEW